jgi:hypothetical protein
MLSRQTDPVVDLVQSDNLLFEKMSFPESVGSLFRLSGERSASIRLKSVERKDLGEKILFELGATEQMLRIE